MNVSLSIAFIIICIHDHFDFGQKDIFFFNLLNYNFRINLLRQVYESCLEHCDFAF